MTGPDGDLSSPALPGNSRRAVPHPSGQSWMCGQCLTSGRSKLFKSRQAANGHMRVHTSLAKQQAEGGKKKRTAKVSNASGMSQSRSPSGKQSKSHRASFGLMFVDNNQPQRQVQQVHEEKEMEKELARNFPKFPQRNSNKMKGDCSIMVEDGASLSAGEPAKRKEINLNEPPADNENDDEKGA